jgi:hypothetical protein
LSDDRIIIRKQHGAFWAHGTPWHGDALSASPASARLDRIYVIRHAQTNVTRRLAASRAASELLVRSFPTFWDADGMGFTLGFLAEMTQEIPCYELGFVPDGSVVDFLRQAA